MATYYGNTRPIEKIASERIDAAAKYERMCKQLDGPDFVRKWRTAEMRIVPDQRTAHIIGHHTLRAKENLQATTELLEQPFAGKGESELYPRRHRCNLIRKLPEALLNRLEPVFSQSALFDPAQKFKKQFDAWQQSLVSQLDQAERTVARGQGLHTRRYIVYRKKFDDTRPTIEAWFDKLIALLAEAGHIEANITNKQRTNRGALND